MTGFARAQTAQLLKPIAASRVLNDGKGHSHVSQQDVTAHLIRMFGFGGFDTEVLAIDCVFERVHVKDGKEQPGRFDVCYRALVRLTVRNPDGQRVCMFEDGATATAQNQTLGDAHDLAYKSALSLAKKRCAVNLGDQFGLSLYNKGQTAPLVIGTLVGVDDTAQTGDVQDGVPEQVSLGDSEPAVLDEATFDTSVLERKITASTTPDELASVGAEINATDAPASSLEFLRGLYRERMGELQGVPA